jgi:rubredoxin
MNIETLKRRLEGAARNERHYNVAETRYWFDQYKQIARDAVKALLKQPAQPLTDADYYNACLSYRHDFGLMSDEDRQKLVFEAKEWARAFGITSGEATLAQQSAERGEPVTFYRCNGCGHAYEQVHPTSCDCMEGSSFEQVNYYTSPPAREWVGLTEDEFDDLRDNNFGISPLISAVEAKLKEKNT